MDRNKLCKILRLFVKDMERLYLSELKSLPEDWRETRGSFMQDFSTNFKTLQKIIEYLRKGYKYDFSSKNYGCMSDDNKFKKISLNGRNTWKKNNDFCFEMEIFEGDFKKYEEIVNREYKLKRILS